MSNITCKAIFRMMLIGASASLAACDGGGVAIDAGPDSPTGCTASNATVMIANNSPHGPHALVVPSADVTAGIEKTYDIMGQAQHTHTIVVTAAQFTMLQGGGTIMATST